MLSFCLITIFFMKYCFCTVSDIVNFPDSTDEKTIDSNELNRRRTVVEAYLKEKSDTKEEWIETYQENFPRNSVLNPSKTKQKNSFENEYDIHSTFPFQNVDLYSVKNLNDFVSQDESLFSGINSVKNQIRKLKVENSKKVDEVTSEKFLHHSNFPDLKKYENLETIQSESNFDNIYQSTDKVMKNEAISSKRVTDQILEKSLKTDKNSDGKRDSLENDGDETLIFHGSKKISLSSKMGSKKLGIGQTNSKSKKLGGSINFEMCTKDAAGSKENKLHQSICHSSLFKNNDLQMNDFKNLTINEGKIIEIMLENSKFISKKYFINSETFTLTEFYKLQENLAHLSFLQRNNNVYSINRMKIIDTIGEITPLLNQEKCKELYNFFNTTHDINNYLKCKNGNIKNSVTNFKKRFGERISTNRKDTRKKVKDSSFVDAPNNVKNAMFSSLENLDTNFFSGDSETLRRKKIMISYLATLNNNKENWIETYHLNYLKNEPERNLFSSVTVNNFKENKSGYNIQNTLEQTEAYGETHSQERLYIIRWINKLQSKLRNSYNGFSNSLSILISDDFHEKLAELSQKFDIVMLDEIISNIISNASFHYNYENTLYFDYKNIFRIISFLPNSTVIYVFLGFVAFLFSFVLLRNFTLQRLAWFLIFVLVILPVIWHGLKIYQQKIAEKHTVMSRVVPSYCESILTKETGIYAHFKEYFRHLWHDEDCKKYYEAVMVDASAEISFYSICTDMLSDALFQMLQPVGRNMNSFFKTLTYDLSFMQQIFIIVITGFIIVVISYFCLSFLALTFTKYKINFPFYLGSVEPTQFCVGSRVEEIDVKESYAEDFSTTCGTSLVKYTNKTENKNHVADIILKELLDSSKYCVHKIPRTRRSSV